MKFLLSILVWLGVSSVIYGAVALVINPNQTGPVHLFRPALVDDRVPKTDLFKKFAGSGPVARAGAWFEPDPIDFAAKVRNIDGEAIFQFRDFGRKDVRGCGDL